MTTLNTVKWINPKDLKEDINFLQSLTYDYINRDLGSVTFMMHLKTMINRVTRITKDVTRVADMRHLQYKLDKLLGAMSELGMENATLRLKVRDIADEVIENLYDEYVRL